MRITTKSPVRTTHGTHCAEIVPDTKKRWRVGIAISFAVGREVFATGVCAKVSDITIDYTNNKIYVNSCELTNRKADSLALSANFAYAAGVYYWFRANAGKFPYQVAGTFRGKLIEWQLNPMP